MDPLTPTARRQELEALLRLAATRGVGPVRLRRALHEVGSARALLGLGARERARRLGVARAVPGPPGPALAILAECRQQKVQVVAWDEPTYPERLRHLCDPPPILFVRGRVDLLAGLQVAVVGSRAASGYGRRVAGQLAAGLARAGVTVLSGLARGVDGAAHAGALRAGGASTAVSGCGAERAHPRAHAALYRELVRRGAVASEHPPGTDPLPAHFPRRNRLLAALARLVVIVEAAEKSGALITARLAAELGRDVMAVPGPIEAATSRGTNALIRDGAPPVLGVQSVLDLLGLGPGDMRLSPGRCAPLAMGPDAEIAWAAVDAVPRSIDELSLETGLDPGRALAALTRLELGGWVRQEPGLRFLRAPE